MNAQMKNINYFVHENRLIETTVNLLVKELQPYLEQLVLFDPDEIGCDETFTRNFTQPILQALGKKQTGNEEMIPAFERRFLCAMLHTRDAICLLAANPTRICLVENYMDKLPEVLREHFKRSIDPLGS